MHAGEFRHLAPAEMALLNGLSPKGPWGPHPRLAVRLIGQLASPLQSGRIFAHLRNFVCALWPRDLSPLSPMDFLATARSALLHAAADLRLRGAPVTGDGNPPAVVPEPPLAPEESSTEDVHVAPAQAAEVVDLTHEPRDLPAVVDLPVPAPAPRDEVPGSEGLDEDDWGRHRSDTPRPRVAPYHVGHGGTRMREVEATAPISSLQFRSRRLFSPVPAMAAAHSP